MLTAQVSFPRKANFWLLEKRLRFASRCKLAGVARVYMKGIQTLLSEGNPL